ncbi:MAG: aldehyde dehydrogenase family protein, partial [Myxococcota bacterium]
AFGHAGQKCSAASLGIVVAEVYDDPTFRRRLRDAVRSLRVGAATDPETKKFPVEVEFLNERERLLPGMVATIILDLGSPDPRTVIPREAAVEEFGLRFVWVAQEEDGALVVRRRRIGVRELPFEPARLEVLSGLAAGEVIVVSGIRELREGERVRSNGSNAPSGNASAAPSGNASAAPSGNGSPPPAGSGSAAR